MLLGTSFSSKQLLFFQRCFSQCYTALQEQMTIWPWFVEKLMSAPFFNLHIPWINALHLIQNVKHNHLGLLSEGFAVPVHLPMLSKILKSINCASTKGQKKRWVVLLSWKLEGNKGELALKAPESSLFLNRGIDKYNNHLPVKNWFSVQMQKITCIFIRVYAQKLCNSTRQVF